MKITGYVYKGEMIHLTTDDSDYTDFVYFKDKFNNLNELKTEIIKKIRETNKKKENKEAKINKVKADLDKEIGGE